MLARRTRLALFATLALAHAVAHAQAPAPPPARPAGPKAAPPLVFDVTDYNASASAPDNLQAFRRTVLAAKAKLKALQPAYDTPPTAIVHIPGADRPYNVSGPVFVDWPGIEIRGDGGSTDVRSSSGMPAFVVGVDDGTAVDWAKYRPDSFGKLDASLAPAPGKRRAFRTNGDGYLHHFGPLSHGPPVGQAGALGGWRDTPRFTIDVAVEGFDPAGKLPAGLRILGIAMEQAGTSFALSTAAGGRFAFQLSTQPERYGPPSTRGNYALSWPVGDAAGVRRVTVQVDLEAGSVLAWVDGVQAAVAGAMPPPGSRLWENLYAPFQVNGTYTALAAADAGAGGDFAVHGLNISKGLRYAAGAPGSPQVARPKVAAFPWVGPVRYLLLPGDPDGGAYSLGFGAATAGPIPAGATAARSRRRSARPG